MAKKPTHVVLGQAAIKSLPNINPFLLADTTHLSAALRQLDIVEVYTHSLVDFETHAPEFLAEIVQSLAAKWTINLHDYKVICPRINLADEQGVYCGEPDEDGCNRCLAERGSDFGVVDIQQWRALHQHALALADTIIVPDQDVAERLLRYLPSLCFTVLPHETIDLSSAYWQAPAIYPDEKLKIVIIGAIGKLKGYQALLACAKRVKQEQLPIEFIVLGYTMNDKLLTEQSVRVTGKYLEHEALDKLIALAPHAVWLPSLWPETYSYTFSLALRVHCPVFAFDIGALARRAKATGMNDFIMPLAWQDSPNKIVEQFEAYRLANIKLHQSSN
jgi:glycosyltransferase involved in cell wall biosynthesis